MADVAGYLRPGRLESIQYLVIYSIENQVFHYEIQENGKILTVVKPWHCLRHYRGTHPVCNDENSIAIGVGYGKLAWESAQILIEWLQGQYNIPKNHLIIIN